VHQPATRPAGKLRQQGAGAQPERRDQSGGEAEDGDGDDDRLGQDVGGDRDQADPTGDRGNNRRRDQMRRRRDREPLCQDRGHASAPQGLRPAGRDQQQPSRGQHRHRETGIVRQQRIQHQQRQRRGRERRERLPRPPGRERHECDQRHRRSAEHAGRRPGDDDERHQHDACGHRA
jgi:hypothetical protein